MLLTKKIKLNVTEKDVATLEFMQGKCRGLYNWWVLRLKSGEQWRLYECKKTLAESRNHDPELNQVYGKLLAEVYVRLDAAMSALRASSVVAADTCKPCHCGNARIAVRNAG